MYIYIYDIYVAPKKIFLVWLIVLVKLKIEPMYTDKLHTEFKKTSMPDFHV